jgi:hypothetical protein
MAQEDSHNSSLSGARVPVIPMSSCASRFMRALVRGVLSVAFGGGVIEPKNAVNIDWRTMLDGSPCSRDDQNVEYALALGASRRDRIAEDVIWKKDG